MELAGPSLEAAMASVVHLGDGRPRQAIPRSPRRSCTIQATNSQSRYAIKSINRYFRENTTSRSRGS